MDKSCKTHSGFNWGNLGLPDCPFCLQLTVCQLETDNLNYVLQIQKLEANLKTNVERINELEKMCQTYINKAKKLEDNMVKMIMVVTEETMHRVKEKENGNNVMDAQ